MTIVEKNVEKILNPKTNRLVSVNSRLGKQILKNIVKLDDDINKIEIKDISDFNTIIETVDDIITPSIISITDDVIESSNDTKKRIRDRKEYMKKYYENKKTSKGVVDQ
jgi:hypothetical protein